MQTVYQLYRISALPLPATNERGTDLRYWTHIVSVPEYLAVPRDLSSYLPLTRDMLEMCEGTTLKICRKAWAFWESSHQSCAMSLYHDDHTGALKHCKIDLIKKNIEPQIQDIGDGRILPITNDTEWLLVCAGLASQPMKGCHFCIISLQCNCAIQMGPLHVPRTQGACNESTMARIVVKNTYPLNVAFHQLERIQNFTGKTYSPEAWKYELPDWETSKFKFNQVMTRDAEIRMHLNELVEKTKQNIAVYDTPADYLADKFKFPLR